MSDPYESDSFASRSHSRASSPSSRRSSPSTARRSPRGDEATNHQDDESHDVYATTTDDGTSTARRIVDEEEEEHYRDDDEDDRGDEPSQVVISGVPISHNPDGSTTRVLSAGQFRQLFQQNIAKSHHFYSGGDSTTAASTPSRGRNPAAPSTPHSHPRPPSAAASRGGSKAANRLRGATKSTRPVHGTGRAISSGSDRGFIDPYRCTKFKNAIHAPLPHSAAAKVGRGHAPIMDYDRTSTQQHRPSNNGITSRREDIADERAEAYRKELVQTKHELSRMEKQIDTMKVKSQRTNDNLSKAEAVMTRGRPQSEADALVNALDTLRGRNAIQTRQITELEEQVYQLKLNARASKVGELQTQCGMFASEIQRLQIALQSNSHVSPSSNGVSPRNRGNVDRSTTSTYPPPSHQSRDNQINVLQEKVQSLREDLRLAESDSSKWKSLYNAERPRIAEAQKRMEEMKSAPTEIYRLKTELETTSARLRDTQNQLHAHLEAKSSEQSGMRGTVEQLVAERDRLAQQLIDNEAVATEQRGNMAQREREIDVDVAKKAHAAVEEERALGADREKVLRNQINDLKAQVQTLEELNTRQKADHESDISKLKLLEQQRQENLLSTVNKHEKEREEELIRGVEEREKGLQREVVSLQEQKRDWESQTNQLQRRLEEERAAHTSTQQKLQRTEQQLREAPAASSIASPPPPPSTHVYSPPTHQSASPVVHTPPTLVAFEPPSLKRGDHQANSNRLPSPPPPPATAAPEVSAVPPSSSESSLRRDNSNGDNSITTAPSGGGGGGVKTTRYHRQDDLMSEVTVQIRRPQNDLGESEGGRNSPGSLRLEGSMVPTMSGIFEGGGGNDDDEEEELVSEQPEAARIMGERENTVAPVAEVTAPPPAADYGVAAVEDSNEIPFSKSGPPNEEKTQTKPGDDDDDSSPPSPVSPPPAEDSNAALPVPVLIAMDDTEQPNPPTAAAAGSGSSSSAPNNSSSSGSFEVPNEDIEEDPPLPIPNPIAGMVSDDAAALDFGEDTTEGSPKSSNAPAFEVDSVDSSGEF